MFRRADAITNGDFNLFDPVRRVSISLDDITLIFFRKLCASHDEFVDMREGQTELKLAEGKQTKRQKLSTKTAW